MGIKSLGFLKKKDQEAQPVPTVPELTREDVLLTLIRDLLKSKQK